MESEHLQPSPPGALPPIETGGLPPPISKWPSVVGTISIVLASLGLVCYGCGTVNGLVSAFMGGIAAPGQQPPPPAPGPVAAMQIGSACVSTLLSAWLLAAGIGLLRRRPWGRPGAIGWAVAKLVVAVVSTAIAIVQAEQAAQYVNDAIAQGSSQGGGSVSFKVTAAMLMSFYVAALLWSLIWPVFLLAWLSRARIRDEVRSWEELARDVI